MTTPIPNCPQPETPIRERAWADGQRPEPKYSDAEIGKKLRRLSAEMRNELCGDFADKLDAILASHQATVESLEDALFQISVRLGEVREPDMDDMSWHTQLIARAQYLADHQPTPDKAGVSDADALAHFTEYFVRNYPGPDTIISNPKWHAPKIFRAARYAITHFASQSAEAVRDGAPERITEAPLYWERGGGVKTDAATAYCCGWNECLESTKGAKP